MRYRILRAGFVFSVFLLLFTAGCTGPLEFTYSPANGTPVKKIAGRPSVLVRLFNDERPVVYRNPRTIGKITSTVIDMNSRELTLSSDVTAVAREAFIREFEKAGFLVVSGDPALTNSDFELYGTVKDFRLDVGPRDDIAIAIAAKFTEKSNGNVVWSDTVSEKREDYVGIWGETKSHLSKYISNALAKAARTAVAGVEEKLSAAQPAPPAAQKTGKLSIVTDPDRAEIYIDDVYYGLTPLSMDLKPGIYEVTAKKKGLVDAKQKVSVREAETTELSMTLGKQ